MQIEEYVVRNKDYINKELEWNYFLHLEDHDSKLSETVHIIADKLDLAYEQVSPTVTKEWLQKVMGNEFFN
jgi:hypothetical protein